jgi:hypothetical protein
MSTLRQAAENFLRSYLELVNSGDCGNWDPETEAEVIALRQALAEPEQEQEPAAWMFEDDYERMKKSETFCEVYSVKVGSPERGETEIELYTAPQQRQWVGLTDDEKHQLNAALNLQGRFPIIEAIEAKLKEKNHG